MKQRRFACVVFLLAVVLTGCTGMFAAPAYTTSFAPIDPFEQNTKLKGGINMGNMLEAPKEGDWGLTLKEEYYDRAKEAGFTSVRLPVRWSAHAAEQAPYTIDPAFFKRMDEVIGQALERDMLVVLDIHHYDELMDDPSGHTPRFLAIWQQIAERYKNYSADLLFEVLNEPHDIGAQTWNTMLAEAITTIRASNPSRNIVVGPLEYYAVRRLPDLELPDDPNLIVTFHYYAPFEFTHQGADWVPNAKQWLGTTWEATSLQRVAVTFDLDRARQWGESENRPIYMGEFGAFNSADIQSRELWTNFVAREAEKRDMSWAYWEFASGFGVYNPADQSWNTPLLEALFP